MNKQSLYVTITNTFIGLSASLLLKDNALVTWVIAGLVIATILYIERAWLTEHLFSNKSSYTYSAYAVLAVIFLVGLFFATEPMRKTTAIIASTTSFLNGVKTGDYKNAYQNISHTSQQDYSLDDFTADHANGCAKIKDFTIEQVTFNRFDSNKALAVVTSPFKIYGHEILSLELVKEEGAWRVVISRKIVATEKSDQAPKAKKKVGALSKLFNSIF